MNNNRKNKPKGAILRGKRKAKAVLCGVLAAAMCMSGMSGLGGVTAMAAYSMPTTINKDVSNSWSVPFEYNGQFVKSGCIPLR